LLILAAINLLGTHRRAADPAPRSAARAAGNRHGARRRCSAAAVPAGHL